MNGGIGASLNNQYPYYPIVENSLLFPNKRVSTANLKPTRQDLTSSYDSALLMESAMLYGSHNNADDYDANDPKPLKLAKRMIIKWKEISASDQFVLSAMFIWGLSVFVCGILLRSHRLISFQDKITLVITFGYSHFLLCLSLGWVCFQLYAV